VTDEERQDEQQPAEEPQADQEQPAENAPGSEAEEASSSASEAPEEPQAEQPAAEEAEESTPEEPQPEQPAAEEPQAEESPEEAPPEAAPQPEAAEKPAEQPKDSAKAKDVPPGAELEPIKLEPQRELSAEERARLEAEEEEERARAEAEATDDTGEEPAPAREAVVDLDADARIQATGKRKTSIARVVLRPGSGEFQINKRTLEDYFPRHQHQTFVRQPLLTSGYEGKVDVRVRVHGGGIAGQAGAVRHGIARALTEIDPELRGELKRRGLLTRDARAKERRKAGLKKARKRPQFSKR
jgi:small subunit ribosomal protein S9